MALLEAQNLEKYFKVPAGQLHAVDGVSFSIERGETLGVVGESGCGKSTLGRVVVHALESTGGKLLYQGEDITSISRKRRSELRKEIQLIFQDPYSSLNPKMTVYQTIEEPLLIERKLNADDRYKKVLELMEMVGLAERLVNTYPHELDGGRRQRIGIARALSLTPKLVVCDEPVSALDVSIQAQVLNLLQDVQERLGLTYIFITHDLSVVKYISNNIMVMYLGQMVEMAPSDDLFKTQLHPYTKALLSAVPLPVIRKDRDRKRIILKGEITSPINPKPGCRFAARCLYARDICTKEMPQITELAPKHLVRCHFAQEINGG